MYRPDSFGRHECYTVQVNDNADKGFESILPDLGLLHAGNVHSSGIKTRSGTAPIERCTSFEYEYQRCEDSVFGHVPIERGPLNG